MDLYKAIADLRAEKKRLDDAIEALERSLAGDDGKRGRVWDSTSRRAAAERMRKYWEKRRADPSRSDAGTASAPAPPGSTNEPSP